MCKVKVRLSTPSSARRFVFLANTFRSDINIIKGKTIIDGKSILGVLNLTNQDLVAQIISNNKDECDIFIEVMKAFN